MPRVSVIMGIYKEPIEWMSIAVNSILEQTFKDFEFIIVNDCPDRKENTQFLAEYSKKDTRIVVVNNDVNIGLTKSLNKALDIVHGEYIARMDADDICLPSRFEKQVAYLDRHPNIATVGSWTSRIDENGSETEIVKFETNPRWIKAQLLQNSQLCHPSAMFRRKIKDYIVRYDESLRYAQDYALWVSIMSYGEISNIPEVLFRYRISGQQITSNKKVEQEECAKIIQKRAFNILGFHPTDSFLNLYFTIVVQHRNDINDIIILQEFRSFFKKEIVTKNNVLAMELIYSTYLFYLNNRKKKSVFNLLKNNTLFMDMLCVKLLFDLFIRKIIRKF